MRHVITYLFQVHGEPDFIRSDNGSEFVSDVVKKWRLCRIRHSRHCTKPLRGGACVRLPGSRL